jgi:hypothetical protein
MYGSSPPLDTSRSCPVAGPLSSGVEIVAVPIDGQLGADAEAHAELSSARRTPKPEGRLMFSPRVAESAADWVTVAEKLAPSSPLSTPMFELSAGANDSASQPVGVNEPEVLTVVDGAP